VAEGQRKRPKRPEWRKRRSRRLSRDAGPDQLELPLEDELATLCPAGEP